MALANQLQAALSGRYTIVRELGGGGMSRVFVAEETQLGRRVVVKVLAPELAQAISVERFEREIRLAASLQHAHIVPVLSNGEVDGLPYFIMPFIDGESLRARVLRGSIPIGECVSILRDVARALAYAHGRDVIHRDIKPDNVMFSAGSAVVTDFGIAKAIHAARSGVGSETLTQLGTSIGTPAYMAPEQAAGDPALDARADLYAFGCTAYELLSGSSPFAGRTPQRMLAAHMTEAPRPIRDIRPDTPPLLADLVMRCLAKDAGARPVSAAEIARTLDNVTSGSTTSTPAILLGGPAMFRRALLIYVAAFAAVAILAKAAIVGIGLPDWVFPGAILVMALGLPMILFTAYVQRVNRQLVMATPTLTPGGTASLNLAAGTMATIAVRATPWVGWNRTARAGLYAGAAFVAVIGGYMLMRNLGVGPFGSLLASGKIGANADVIVADFAVHHADSALAQTLGDAMRGELASSAVIKVVSPQRMNDVLTYMERKQNSIVDVATALDMAHRTGAPIVVAGDVTGVAGSYIVTLKVLETRTGSALAQTSETAHGPNDLINVMDKSARWLRDRLGESLRHVEQAPALGDVSTGSLAALTEYYQGVRANDASQYTVAAELARKAITLDSTFAGGWRLLAWAISNAGGAPSRYDAAYAKAYQLSSRLPQGERLMSEAEYFANAGHNRPKAIELFREAQAAGDSEAGNDLGLYLADRRDFAGVDSVYRFAVRLWPDRVIPYSNWAAFLYEQGRLAGADSVLALAATRHVQSDDLTLMSTQLQITRGRFDSATRILARFDTSENVSIRVEAVQYGEQLSLLQGRVQEFIAQTDTVARLLQSIDAFAPPLEDSVTVALIDAWPGAHPARGVQRLDAALAHEPLRDIPEGDRNYFDVAIAYAIDGRPDKATEIIRAYEAEITDTARRRDELPQLHRALGEIALASHNPRDAIREFRLGDQAPDGPANGCSNCLALELARAFDMAQMPDSAIAMFIRYLQTPTASWGARLWLSDPYAEASSQLRLGELYEDKGDDTEAATHYRAFINLYKDADPDLQPLVASVRHRLAHLGDTAPSTSLPKP